MTTTTPTIEDTTERIYHIHGWSSRPLVRHGLSWAKFTNLSVKDRRTIAAMFVGDKNTLPFRTCAGSLPYIVERVK